MNKQQLYALMASSLGLFGLSACGGGGTSSSGSSSTGSSVSRVEADTVEGKVSVVREYANSKLTKKPVIVIYPHGMHFATAHVKDKRVVTHTYRDRKSYEADKVNLDSTYKRIAQHIKASVETAYGLELGYNPTINQTISGSGDLYNPENNPVVGIPPAALAQFNAQPQCYLYTAQVQTGAPNNGHTMEASFTNTQSDSTFANTFNAKASIAASYGLFKANANFAYSNNYQGSNFGNTVSFLAYDATNASFNLTGLSPMGLYLLASDPQIFQQNCGSSVMQSAILGIGYTASLTATADNAAQQDQVNAQINASYSFASVSASVGESNSSTSASYSLTAQFIQNGDYVYTQNHSIGGTNVTPGMTFSDVLALWEAAQPNGGATACLNSMTPASNNTAGANCKQYLNNLSVETQALISAANADMASSTQLGNNLSLFDIYPDGVLIPDGISVSGTISSATVMGNPIIQTQLANYPDSSLAQQASTNLNSVADPYAGSGTTLLNYVQTMLQINTLANRANFLASLIRKTGYTTSTLEADKLLSNLANMYSYDVTTLQGQLASCLNGPNDTPAGSPSNCANLSLASNNAYSYYQNIDSINDAFKMDKMYNALFLQYSGKYVENGNPQLTPIFNSSAWLSTEPLVVSPPWPSQSTFVADSSSPTSTGGDINGLAQSSTHNMGVFYAHNNTQIGLESGLIAFATQGFNITNPFQGIRFLDGLGNIGTFGNPSTALESYVTTPAQFAIDYPEATIGNLFNGTLYSAGDTLTSIFATGPAKYVNGARTWDTTPTTQQQIAVTQFGFQSTPNSLNNFALQVNGNANANNAYGMFGYTLSNYNDIGQATSVAELDSTKIMTNCYFVFSYVCVPIQSLTAVTTFSLIKNFYD